MNSYRIGLGDIKILIFLLFFTNYSYNYNMNSYRIGLDDIKKITVNNNSNVVIWKSTRLTYLHPNTHPNTYINAYIKDSSDLVFGEISNDKSFGGSVTKIIKTNENGDNFYYEKTHNVNNNEEILIEYLNDKYNYHLSFHTIENIEILGNGTLYIDESCLHSNLNINIYNTGKLTLISDFILNKVKVNIHDHGKVDFCLTRIKNLCGHVKNNGIINKFIIVDKGDFLSMDNGYINGYINGYKSSECQINEVKYNNSKITVDNISDQQITNMLTNNNLRLKL